MSLETQLVALAQAIGGDIGDLADLTTTAKGDLVSAINEVLAAIGDGSNGAVINDSVTNLVNAWSSSKISSFVVEQFDAFVAGAPEALNQWMELVAMLQDQGNAVSAITTSLAMRVRVDAPQTFDGPQQTQARSNIGAASAADLTALSTAIGNTELDLVDVYNTAKA